MMDPSEKDVWPMMRSVKKRSRRSGERLSRCSVHGWLDVDVVIVDVVGH